MFLFKGKGLKKVLTVLLFFEYSSGLKVNFSRCSLAWVNLEAWSLAEYASLVDFAI